MSNVIPVFDSGLEWDENDELDKTWVETLDPTEEVKRLAQEELNLKAALEAIKSTKQALVERQRRLQDRAERCQELRLWVQTNHNLRKVEYPEFTVGVRKSPDVLECVDEEAVEEEYKKVSTSIDKAAVNKAFKETGEIPPGFTERPGKVRSTIYTG